MEHNIEERPGKPGHYKGAELEEAGADSVREVGQVDQG